MARVLVADDHPDARVVFTDVPGDAALAPIDIVLAADVARVLGARPPAA